MWILQIEMNKEENKKWISEAKLKTNDDLQSN